MEQLIEKLEKWFEEEHELLDGLAHDVASAKTLEETMELKRDYELQDVKTATIADAILMFTETK